MIRTASFREKDGFHFPPAMKPKGLPAKVKVGDLVSVRGRKDLGAGEVIDLEPDGRLAKCVFGCLEGWWNRIDLVKAE